MAETNSVQTAIENNANPKALDITAYPLPSFDLYVVMNFDMAIKVDDMYMTLE
jgi:hypothetical protein